MKYYDELKVELKLGTVLRRKRRKQDSDVYLFVGHNNHNIVLSKYRDGTYTTVEIPDNDKALFDKEWNIFSEPYTKEEIEEIKSEASLRGEESERRFPRNGREMISHEMGS